MTNGLTVVAFDLDHASLASLREVLPGWQVDIVNGATASTLAAEWDPGVADLMVVQYHENGEDTLGVCRFLAFCASYSKEFHQANDFRQAEEGALVTQRSSRNQEERADASLLVLVPRGRETFIERALDAGAHSCLLLPMRVEDVATMVAHVLAGNQPGRHTLNLETAQIEDRWRDEGGQG